MGIGSGSFAALGNCTLCMNKMLSVSLLHCLGHRAGDFLHLCPGLNSATRFTIFRFSPNCYDFSLCYVFSLFITSFSVFCLANCPMNIDVSRVADFQKFANFAALTIFRAVLRFFSLFCLANCLMTTGACWLVDFTKFAKFRSLNDFLRCVATFFSLLSS